jgi:ketosteroid isomerase-like protein
MNPLDTVRAFLAALERGAVDEALVPFFAPDALHEQKPNAIYPKGTSADLATMRANSKRGAGLMRSQRYEIVSELVDGSRVVVEVKWTGVLAIALRDKAAGDALVAHCCMVFEHDDDGRIRRQRNYDCYEPF